MDGLMIETANAEIIAAQELRSYVEKIERLRAEQADIKALEKEVFAELKGRGYMARPVRTLIKLRAQDPDQRAEEEVILDLYKASLGMY